LFQEYIRSTIDNPDYDKRVPPFGHLGPGTPIQINITMYILDITRINEEQMEYDAQFYFRQGWYDKRLMSPGLNLSVTLNDASKIWTPDLFFVNEKEGKLHDIVRPNVFLRINATNGLVFYSMRLTQRLSCDMDFRKFPFDTQLCRIRAESYGYTRNFMELQFLPGVYDPVSSTKDITSIDFDLLGLETAVLTEKVSSGNYTNLNIDLKLKRNCGFFISKLFVPSIILTVLSWLSLWIKPKEKYLRLAFLLVILYLMVTVASEAESKSPYVPYAKASDVWIAFCEAMVFLLFLEFIAVCVISNESIGSRGDIMSSFDAEAKETNLANDLPKSSFNKFITIIDLKSGGRGKSDVPSGLDRITRILYPIIFVLFNIVYWSVYIS